MRPIDADALLKNMDERKRPLSGADDSKDRYRYMQWLADYQAIKEAPTVETPVCCIANVTVDTDEILRRIKEDYVLVAGWIPCEERLPENKREKCLVNVILEDSPNKVVISDFVAYDHARGWIDAWMPLPEPYETGREE